MCCSIMRKLVSFSIAAVLSLASCSQQKQNQSTLSNMAPPVVKTEEEWKKVLPINLNGEEKRQREN